MHGGDIKTTMWHTYMPIQANPQTGKAIILSFDLRDAYAIQKMEYYPRTDGGNGTILKLRYRLSLDGKKWSSLSDPILWRRDSTAKHVQLHGTKFRYMEWHILDSLAGFGSGRQVLFHKDPGTFEKGIVERVMATCNVQCENGQEAWILTADREDPFKNTAIVKGVKATCSLLCQPGSAVCKLTDGDFTSIWHTIWALPHSANPQTGEKIKVKFDLGAVYEIQKMDYYPRADAWNGTILKMQYRSSLCGKNWGPLSQVRIWNEDDSVKTIELNGKKMRFVEWRILESVNGFGAGRQVLFYKTPTCTTVTKDPHKNTVKGVKVSCNIPSEPGEEVELLTDGDTSKSSSMWHTQWHKPVSIDLATGDIITLKFDLGNVYEIEKIEYYPRYDAGNGNFLEVEYRYSLDGEKWSKVSDQICWHYDESVKTIVLNGVMFRFMELYVIESVGGFGSGRQILFYKYIY